MTRIEVGKSYRTRSGAIVYIAAKRDWYDKEFVGWCTHGSNIDPLSWNLQGRCYETGLYTFDPEEGLLEDQDAPAP